LILHNIALIWLNLTMKHPMYAPKRSFWPQWLRPVLNLNDSRWGRDDDKASPGTPGATPHGQQPGSQPPQQPPQQPDRPRNAAPAGPPDLDELWRDFNQKLGGIFGGGSKRPPGGGGTLPPNMPGAGVGLSVVGAVIGLIWLSTGFFIVQEGQQAVITEFGKYKTTVSAGFNWRLPYPIQRHELVFVTQIRSIDIGRDAILKATGLKESAMLTEDENILDVKFAVQYRLNDARAFLFESKNPTDAVVQAAETAVREVLGKMKMDAALSEERDQIAPRVRALMQTILDRYNVGIEIVGINLQQGGVRPPEQVQASFDDVLKAGQERERAKNEAQAYANDVIPRAVGTASRLREEAEAYKARVVAQAQGDAQRFKSIYAEYQKAPQVMRDRMYLDTMQQIYGNVTKIIVESRQGSSLLYLPLDKILQSSGAANVAMPEMQSLPATANTLHNNAVNDARARDLSRARERDTR
jgi:membrane protease subunit HflK